MCCLCINSKHLTAQKWSHLNLLATTCECRKLCSCKVVSKFFLDTCWCPGSTNATADVIAYASLKDTVIACHKCWIIAESSNSFGCFKTFFIIEVTYLLAVLIKCKLAAVSKEEGSEIPSIGNIHMHLLASLVSRSQDTVKCLYIFFCKDWLIIIEIVSIISCHRIAI